MNIILLISDTFRYDNLFDRAAAAPLAMPVRTPCLDAFTERAVSLSRLYNGSFPTIPHRTDLTTGRFGWPWYGWQSRLQSSRNHLPEILRQAGYVSQLLCDCPHLFGANFHVGFDAAYVTRGQEADVYFTRMNRPIQHVMPPEKTRAPGGHFGRTNLVDLAAWQNSDWRAEAEEDRFPPRTAALACRWLEENYRHDPFFLWVDFFDPHEPWDPPEYMVRRYDPDYRGTPMLHPNYGKASDYTPEELRNLRAHYCAEAELVDRWVGRVLQKIDDLALWDNSIVIFTTDHGMSIGEHNRTGKSNINPGDGRHWPIYAEVAHIPLMIAAPGLVGKREVEQFIQPPDILPTLLDLAGLQVEPPEPLHGRSFAPLLRGQSAEWDRRFAVTGSHLRLAPEQKAAGKRVTPVLHAERWAYAPIGPEGRRELFDLQADPYCEQDVAADQPGIADDLHGSLIGWLTEMGAPAEAVAALQ